MRKPYDGIFQRRRDDRHVLRCGQARSGTRRDSARSEENGDRFWKEARKKVAGRSAGNASQVDSKFYGNELRTFRVKVRLLSFPCAEIDFTVLYSAACRVSALYADRRVSRQVVRATSDGVVRVLLRLFSVARNRRSLHDGVGPCPSAVFPGRSRAAFLFYRSLDSGRKSQGRRTAEETVSLARNSRSCPVCRGSCLFDVYRPTGHLSLAPVCRGPVRVPLR